jgi:hypothetical protein
LSGRAVLSPTVQRGRIYQLLATISGRAVLTAIPIPPAEDCSCPPWTIEPGAICNWNEDGTLPNTVSESGLHELPFTLPVFRLYVLGNSTSTGVRDLYLKNDNTTCTMANTQTLTNTTSNTATLVNTFSRKGCG